jgi:putative hydrolase of the HAD superfamily
LIGCIIWDFDGTLAVPSTWSGCLLATLDEHVPGHHVTRDDLRAFTRQGFPWDEPDVAHLHLCEPGAWWRHVEALLGRAFAGVGFEERAGDLARLTRDRYLDPSGWRLFPDTVPVLHRLRDAGWRHVVLSNHVPELTQIVGRLGLEDLVDGVLTSAVTGYEKPHPQAFALARAAAGGAEPLWMVGDNPDADVRGAEAAGIPAILVRTETDGVVRQAADLWGVLEIVEPATSPSS